MDVKYNKFYQLGNGGDLIFEQDLDQLSELLEHPHPEFFRAQLNDQGGEDLQWLIVASLRGKIEPPTAEGIQFTLRENNWLDGLARAMQEDLARLCGQSINQIKGTRFEFCPRRDANGQPLECNIPKIMISKIAYHSCMHIVLRSISNQIQENRST